MRRPRVPIALPLTAIALIIVGFIASWAIPTLVSPEQRARNVLINAIPFILIFVGILLGYITLIVLVASALNNLVAPRTYRLVTRVIIAGILLGIAGMFQPWVLAFYTYGFVLLLLSTLAYILWSHVTPAMEEEEEDQVEVLGHAKTSGQQG